jgi:hypothetical protein
MKKITITHKIGFTAYPEFGYATMRKGRPVFITAGHYAIEGRISNHFSWRPIKADGTLGREYNGYWERKWSPSPPNQPHA